MVRKKAVIVGTVMCVCWMLPLLLLAIGKNQYLFPKRATLEFWLWLSVYFFISLVGVTIILAIKFLKSIKFRFLSILLIISLIPQYFINVIGLWSIYASGWQSSTNNVDDFGKIDQYFDDNFEISGLKLSDLMNNHKKATQYNYFYVSKFGKIVFDISFEMELTEKDYSNLKVNFLKSMRVENEENFPQNKMGESGRFVACEYTPTTVDKWDEMYIDYCDSTCTFSMKFKGVCYT